jgi:hypothetical protein
VVDDWPLAEQALVGGETPYSGRSSNGGFWSGKVDHFEKKDYECAITLAGAAEGQIKEKTLNHLFRLMRAKWPSDEANMFIHWMKHASGPENAEIEELEVVTTIIRAIQKYVGAYETMHPKFQTFSDWCVAKGYTKKPLGEKNAE